MKEMVVLQDCTHKRVVRYVGHDIEYDKDAIAIHLCIVMEYMEKVIPCFCMCD